MELAFPDLPQQVLDFRLSAETVRSLPSEDSAETDISRRVMLGGPQAHPLTEATAGDRYDLQVVFLDVTFRSEDKDPPFEKATVEIVLSTSDGVSEPPVALSMTPQWATNPITVSRKLTLSPELTFGDLGVSLGSAEHSTTRTDKPPAIRAYGQRTSNPSWRFTASPGLPIEGTYALAMTVQSLRGTEVSAIVRVEPYVRHRFLLHFENKPLPPVMLGARL